MNGGKFREDFGVWEELKIQLKFYGTNISADLTFSIILMLLGDFREFFRGKF
jgi:hypothetical protein